jgi:hypothetical protein
MRPDPRTPPLHDWRTTDSDEIARRRQRARDEKPQVENRTPEHPVFSNFRVISPSGSSYDVELRDVAERRFACTCVDFRTSGLGTCKHVEATLLHNPDTLRNAPILRQQTAQQAKAIMDKMSVFMGAN